MQLEVLAHRQLAVERDRFQELELIAVQRLGASAEAPSSLSHRRNLAAISSFPPGIPPAAQRLERVVHGGDGADNATGGVLDADEPAVDLGSDLAFLALQASDRPRAWAAVSLQGETP